MGKTDYTSIKDMHTIITVNKALVKSTLSGGNNGYLSLVLLSDQCACLASNTIEGPADPRRMATVLDWTQPGKEKRILR